MNENSKAVAIGDEQYHDWHDVINKVASLKNVDISNLERLMAMQIQREERRAASHYNTLMAQAQADMGQVSKDSVNPVTRSRYASLAALDEAIRAVYTQYGFSVEFNDETPTDRDANQGLLIAAYVANGPERRRFQKWIPISTTGIAGRQAMTATHASIAAVTYGRRALLKMVFNIAEVDDDGNTAGGRTEAPASKPKSPSEMIAEIRATKNVRELHHWNHSSDSAYLALPDDAKAMVDEAYRDQAQSFTKGPPK